MLDSIVSTIKSIAPAVDFYSIRAVDENQQWISVRQHILQPLGNIFNRGVNITVCDRGGLGYAATCDLSASGLKQALYRARNWAHETANLSLFSAECVFKPQHHSKSSSFVEQPWASIELDAKLDRLQQISQQLKNHDQIIDWWATLDFRHYECIFATPDAQITQSFSTLTPYMGSVANQGTETQQRTFGVECSGQSGLELLARIEFADQAERISDQALALLAASDCPCDRLDLLLVPNQMILQIHESIGHPLELDRILGDERNYAGTSFVTLDMFGKYRYGSDILNVTFDPEHTKQIASYTFDDEGSAAERRHLIKNGILLRPLGGYSSQQRAGIQGVACSRSSGWNRPPIDRMANINLEPGDTSLESMIALVEHGILMDTNKSWSIDDSRNKFQFGCEIGRRIENGEVKEIVKNPNYRGISSEFWRNLTAVGDRNTCEVLSVPTCGKGEPNQAIQVGHASPACLFRNVDVFGGG